MALVQNFVAETSVPNEIDLTWNQPLDFNNAGSEIIVTRTTTHYPSELFNSSFPNTATDPRGIEIFRGSTIVGLNPGTITVVGSTLTDTSASFPTSPPLNGRLLRDQNSKVFRIKSNTATSITVDSGSPASGIYVVLADFPTIVRIQQNFELDSRTSTGAGFISNLVQMINGVLTVVTFIQDEAANLIFIDGNGTKFIVKSNNSNTLFFYETAVTPVVGVGMALANNFNNSEPIPYKDTFLNSVQAAVRIGTGLRDNQFYYYTAFNNGIGLNVAQAEFSTKDSGTPTQAFAISTKDRQFGNLLYNLWPSLYRELDTTGDLQDLMQVFGFQLNQIHSFIDTYNLQDTQTVLGSTSTGALEALSEQSGLPTVGFSIGIDTLRRIANDLISAWRLKGSKEGIALFIRILTTWDITNGTGDFSGAISDFLPNISSLRWFDATLGNTNTRLTTSVPFTAGGRFPKSLPGIIIPGFFTFREFVVTLPHVAMFIGTSTGFSVSASQTVMTDNNANFGAVNSLVGNFLLPNEQEPNDIFRIIANTNTTITVSGIVNNRDPGGKYAVLSPLNTNRFVILNKLMPLYEPFGTRPGWDFV